MSARAPIRFVRAVLLLALLTIGCAVWAQTYPDYRDIYVNDFADVLSGSEEDEIRTQLQALGETHGIEFTVVTIRSMTDYGHDGPIEPFATGLFNRWGIGNAQRNDGVMMLIAVDDRHMRIEVGSGYGSSKNDPMKDIIDRRILPKFKNSDYSGGIRTGVAYVIRYLTGYWPGEEGATIGQRVLGAVRRFLDFVGNGLWLLLAPVPIWGLRLFRRWRRNRPRICPIDGSTMYRLEEFEDDAHLKPGQVTEENIESVDYDVWSCPTCSHLTIEAYTAWFSGYGACRECGFRTVQGESTVLEHATKSSEGLRRIDYSCHHCGAEYSTTQTIPRETSSSSSSSSFGGGSSSGGGASGSW